MKNCIFYYFNSKYGTAVGNPNSTHLEVVCTNLIYVNNIFFVAEEPPSATNGHVICLLRGSLVHFLGLFFLLQVCRLLSFFVFFMQWFPLQTINLVLFSLLSSLIRFLSADNFRLLFIRPKYILWSIYNNCFFIECGLVIVHLRMDGIASWLTIISR